MKSEQERDKIIGGMGSSLRKEKGEDVGDKREDQ